MPTRIARACFGAWMVALTAAFYAWPQAAMYTWAAIGLSGAAAVVAGVRIHRPSQPLPWFLLAGVLVLFTAGDTTYNVLTDILGQQDPFPSGADFAYLLVYPLLAGALLILIRARSGGDNRAGLLDALVPTAGLGLLSWVFWIAPYVRDTDLTVVEKLVSVAYPLGDVLALAMLLRLLTAPGRRQQALTVLGAGVASLLVTDVLYGMSLLNGTWATGGPTDLGWVFFYAALGYAALHPSMAGLTESALHLPHRAVSGRRRLSFMVLAALIAPAVLLVQDLRGTVHDAPVIAILCAVMFLLVHARLAGLLGTQEQAGARERALREAAALLVAATTRSAVAEAAHRAVAQLMPPGEPYELRLAAEDVPDTDPADAADHTVTLLRGADLPPAAAAHLADFGSVLHASIRVTDPDSAVPAGRRLVQLAAAEPVLRVLQPSFEALISQNAMADERIALTTEITRRNGEAYFRTLIQSASDVILIVDADDRISYASPSAETVLDRPDLLGATIGSLIAGTDHDGLHDMLARARLDAGAVEGVGLIAVRADRRLLHVECGCRDLRADPTVAGLVLTLRDVTERRRLEHDLAHQAFHDSLTGLANRVLLQNRIEHSFALAQRTGSMVGIIVVDVDDFKEVNDTFGHTVGDQLLVTVGQRIAQIVGPLNTAARMGADEFAVLVEQARDPEELDQIAARIVEALAVPVEVADGHGGSPSLNCGASIGVATSIEAHSTDELQRQADLALYVAKREGKGNWQRYQGNLHTAMVERLELRAALNEAAAGGQLRLQYQPIVDLDSERIVGVEALVRWEHPTRGFLGPQHFIEVAEENGAIAEIGAWVLCEALDTLAGWRADAPDSSLRYVSVNVSARQFRTPGFVEQVRNALATTRVPPESLLLEITESLLLRDDEQVWSDLRSLRELGVRVAIDDFGTGYSSLSYLRQMPVDVLKIDKSFIDDVMDSEQQRALVEAIVTLADNLHLRVVAEGIEERGQREMLLEMGCPYGQGYLFSRPVWPSEIAGWLTQRALAG